EVRRHIWGVARDGAAPPILTARSTTPGGASAHSSSGWGATTSHLKLATAAALPAVATTIPLPHARAPIAVFAEYVGEMLRRTADRFLKLEPWYVVPAA